MGNRFLAYFHCATDLHTYRIRETARGHRPTDLWASSQPASMGSGVPTDRLAARSAATKNLGRDARPTDPTPGCAGTFHPLSTSHRPESSLC